MSRLEEQEVIDDEILSKISVVLQIPVQAIKQFDEQAAVQIISNTFNDEASAYSIHYKCTINPLETVMQLMEENKKLYEQLLASEREKVQLLQRMLDKQ